MLALAFIASLLATLSLATSPFVPGPEIPCYVNDNNFTMYAVYKNGSSTKEPLALGSAASPDPLAWLAATASLKTVIAKNFTMTEGKVIGKRSDGSEAAVSEQVPTVNGILPFRRVLVTGQNPVPVQTYCELIDMGSERPPLTLAVHVFSDDFYLCRRSGGNEVLVVYNATKSGAPGAGFEYKTCKPVYVGISHVD